MSCADFRQVMSSVDGMTIDREPEPVKVGAYPGYRIDFSGGRSLSVDVWRSKFVAMSLTFNLTSRDPEVAHGSGEVIGRPYPPFEDKDWPRSGMSQRLCAASENVLHRIEPDGDCREGRINSGSRDRGNRRQREARSRHSCVRCTTTGRRRGREAVAIQALPEKQGSPAEVETGVIFRRGAPNM